MFSSPFRIVRILMHPIVWMEDNKKEPRLQHLLQIVGIFYSAKIDPNHHAEQTTFTVRTP